MQWKMECTNSTMLGMVLLCRAWKLCIRFRKRKTRSPEINIRLKLRDEFGVRCVWRHFDFVVYKLHAQANERRSAPVCIWYELYWVGGMLNTCHRRIKYALDFTHRVPRLPAFTTPFERHFEKKENNRPRCWCFFFLLLFFDAGEHSSVNILLAFNAISKYAMAFSLRTTAYYVRHCICIHTTIVAADDHSWKMWK